ncbi:glycosyltransferase family 4 protein [Pannus brasiliensis CCIBt3594]|uniref:Glycosyltransferase family 4 protein n=1 Tax=Pannus brasiliensis CCIBt3594 TaxID=1427578 RepID=A0AAW9QFI2_9CHRO
MIDKVLFLSTPVGPLGSGSGGGVELTLYNLARALEERGIQVTTIAPENSVLDGLPLETVPGTPQVSAQNTGREAPIELPPDSVLANMWERARQIQRDHDLIVNFAYDWLPLYLTPFFERPVAHLIGMASLAEAIDRALQDIHARFPRSIAFHTVAQAETFPLPAPYRCLGNGIDLSRYRFRENPSAALAWVGRIAPEKALEDAIEACDRAGVPLRVFGYIPDRAYWEKLLTKYPNANLDYRGFLPTDRLQAELGDCRGLVMTPRWVEAFGNVAIEALACGVPVISYRRGGPAEIIEDGKTGFLVEPDSIGGLVRAIDSLDRIARRDCRERAEREYSREAFGDRVLDWFTEILDA